MLEKYRSSKAYKMAGYSGYCFSSIIILIFIWMRFFCSGWGGLAPLWVLITIVLPVIFYWTLFIHIYMFFKLHCVNNILIDYKADIGYIILLVLTLLTIVAGYLVHDNYKLFFIF